MAQSLAQGATSLEHATDDGFNGSPKPAGMDADCAPESAETAAPVEPTSTPLVKAGGDKAMLKHSQPCRAGEASASRASRVEQRRARQEAERRAYEEATCPSGHLLTGFSVQYGYPCDTCSEGACKEGITMWGCRFRDERGVRTCDYDVCEACKIEAVKKKLRQEARRRDKEQYERLNREYHAQKAKAEVAEAAAQAAAAHAANMKARWVAERKANRCF